MAEQLKQQRANTKKNISRIKGIIEANGRGEGKALTATELRCRLGILDSYFNQLMSYQTQIEKIEPDDNSRGDLEDLYVTIKIAIQDQLGEDLNSSSAGHNSFVVPSLHSKVPPLKLPTFDGKYSEYKNFITSFSQTIDREVGLSSIEKFNHLLNCLSGQALETVKAFQVTHENYQKALDRLKSRYDNKALIFLENITSLFELPATNKATCIQLRSLVDNVSALRSSLQSLGSDTDIFNSMLIHLVMQKVDDATEEKWKESLDFNKLPTWEECAKVLERRCQFLETIESSHHHGNARKVDHKHPKRSDKRQPQRQNYSFSCTKRACVLCGNDNHTISNCQEFNNMPIAERFENAKRLALCINCLSKNHKVTQCTSAFKCKVCNRSHHTLLHRSSTTPPPALPSSSPVSSSLSPSSSFQPATTSAVVHTHLEPCAQDAVILATAIVLVRDATGRYQLGRALLDSCSQVNLMTEDFSQRLSLPRRRQDIQIRSIGDINTRIKHKTFTNIKSRFTNFELSLSFCVTSHISYQPDSEIDISSWNLPPNTKLADENFFKSKRIDLLIGTEGFFDMLSIGQIKLGNNLPTLQKTLLGWVVSGKYSAATRSSSTCLLSCEEMINYNLEQLWKLDEITAKSSLSDEQVACESSFVKTVSRDHAGRIIVRLPFKEDPARLGSSREIALRRFNALERRLSRTPELRMQYVKFMDEYEQLGHMSYVKNPALHLPHYYIPHHCVLKPNSTSTKLRVVFDASCLTSKHNSLNDLLMVGATIQDDLVTLLLRFRLRRYVITADIVKMYRQVLVDVQDRCFQYILWRGSNCDNVCTYQLNTVTYGTAAAPYLAIRSLQYVADQYAAEFPLGSRMINSSFYVDDFLCGADSVEKLTQIKYEVSTILQRGCMELAKWHSNVESLVDERSMKELALEDSSVISALGITWDQKQDLFLFSFSPRNAYTGKPTKRTILSLASSLFDPLGLLAPLLITAKIILQELWLLKLNWDESVPQNLQYAWEDLLKELASLSSISVPRYTLHANTIQIQLHGFCDASIRAYGCCIYTRSENNAGNVIVNLLTAKSRVAPTRKKSLPKLELCGAQLLAQLLAKIKDMFPHQISQIFLWCDSQIVLHWLQMHSSTLSTFVGNRISEIQELTADCSWRYVPTLCNPADIVSRGCTIQELKHNIWFSGPAFLVLHQNYWPENCRGAPDMEELNQERRKATFFGVVKTNYLVDSIAKYSSHTTAVRVIAWMIRFYLKCSRSINSIPIEQLSPQEIETSLWCIIWNIQQQYFHEDICRAEKGTPAEHTLKHLNPFLEDTCGFKLLKVGGRLELASVPNMQRHPVLLPTKCQFVERLVRHLHIKNFHAGPKALVAIIRLQFWVINARDLARRIVRSCVHCVRYRPKLLQQMMGNLPSERLTPCRPFLRCAVDFGGPILTYLRLRGKTPYKTYIALFVCMWSKAVHIEVVSDLSTEAFIAALKRMIGRRGLPSDIFCDNATNFVGANRRLADLKEFLFESKNKNIITKFCSNEFINFNFIPPRAPHFGGLWEAAIKSAKGHLYRTILNARLTYEELTTTLIEIEAILNSRPISPLSSDPSDPEALTPAHFLIGSSLKALPEHTAESTQEIHHLEGWVRISTAKHRFWQHWSKEYLSELQVRTKWVHDQPNVYVDSLVLIHEDNLPPQRWSTGRIVAVIPGKDNRIRVVDIKTSSGIIKRPIHKLALLPI